MEEQKKEFDKFEEKGRTGMIAMCIALLGMIVYGLLQHYNIIK